MTEDHLQEEQQAQIYVSSLARAFSKARGDKAELERTPEYLAGGARLLKSVYGSQLAAYLCRLEETRRFNRWCRAVDLPERYEAIGLLAAIETTEILLGKLTAKRAKEWMITPCAYILDNLPMDFIREDADLVRRAALQHSL